MPRPLAVTILLLVLGACRGDRPAAAAPGSFAVDPSSTPGAVVLQLWQLREGVTLGEWHTAHPEETVAGDDSTALTRSFGDWCAFAGREITVGTRPIRRAMFFYVPDPGDLTPPDTTPDLARECVAGLVWVSIPAADSTSGAHLADSIGTQLAVSFGDSVPGPMAFWGSAWWSHTRRFRRDSTTVVSALRGPPASAADSARHWAVIAFAYRRASGITSGAVDEPAPASDAYAPVDSVPLDSAVALARLDSTLWLPLRHLVRTADTAAGRVSASAVDSLVRPLRRWLQAAASLPAARHAAALYAADVTLERSLCHYARCGTPDAAPLAPLRALGAQFTWAELGGTWVYERSWMNQARALNRDSPLGDRIFLAQMATAFDPSGTCAAGTEGFRRVIANGERYLARVPAGGIAADVHYEVAEAYRDIVALARGAGGVYADSSRYGDEAGTAARRALLHYREAMRAGPGAPVARAAWRRAWALQAGLVPQDLRFFCVYD